MVLEIKKLAGDMASTDICTNGKFLFHCLLVKNTISCRSPIIYMDNAGLSHQQLLQSIEFIGKQVSPIINS
jgi:hypothetical protein